MSCDWQQFGSGVGQAWLDGFAKGVADSVPAIREAARLIEEVVAEARWREFAAQRELVDYLLTVPWWVGLRGRLRLRSAKRWAG